MKSAQTAEKEERDPEVKKTAKRRVGRPRQVSINQILDKVLQIGLDNLSLHTLAAALNVTPSALYRHVESKPDLERRFVDRITAEYPVPDFAGEDWDVWVRDFALALYHMYTSVPGLADFSVRRTITSDSVIARHETAIRAARSAGFSDAEAFYATRAIIDFVSGSVARNQRRDAVLREEGIHPTEYFRHLVSSDTTPRYPELKQALSATRLDPPDCQFLFTLDAMITGLLATRGKRATPADGPPPPSDSADAP